MYVLLFGPYLFHKRMYNHIILRNKKEYISSVKKCQCENFRLNINSCTEFVLKYEAFTII